MNTSELRIGNLVAAPHGNLRVAEILKNNAISFAPYREAPWTQCHIEMIKPIPLTEECLTRFGFENNGLFEHKMFVTGNNAGNMDGAVHFSIDLGESDYFYVYKKKDKYFYEISSSTDDYGLFIDTREILFAHELQNLHFALTGKELEYAPS